MSAWEAIAYGTTHQASQTCNRYWKHWTNYCSNFHKLDPFLTSVPKVDRSIILTAFAARVRTGAYGRGHQVKVSSVQDAIAAITTTAKLVGQQSPAYEMEGEYILPLKRCIEGFRRQDPPSIPQLAVPNSVPHEAFDFGSKSQCPFQFAQGCLAVIGFYFLLRSGEYTKPRYIHRNGRQVRASRTKQFTVGDVGFFKNGKVLPRSSPLNILRTADSATLKITNQKNGRMGQTLHQQSTGPGGAVEALAFRVHHILSHGGSPSSLLCDVFYNNSWTSVSGSDMVATVRAAVTRLQLDQHGIDSDLVGAHSLRAGGAMALKMAGHKDSTIRQFGRWTSDTWMMYIHSQISSLYDGVAQQMSLSIPFHNISFIEPSQ